MGNLTPTSVAQTAVPRRIECEQEAMLRAPEYEGCKSYTRERYHHLATFCQGDFFGEMAFLDRERRSADVEAATAADLYVLSRERFDALVKTNPALGGRVFEQLAFALSKRLRAADTELRVLEER